MYIYKKERQLRNDDISVHKCRCDEKYRRQTHMHEFVELVYILSGHGVQYIGDKKYNVKHGDLLYINFGQSHCFETDTEFEFVNILINPVFLSRELVNSENIQEIFALSLFEEFGSPHDFSNQSVSFSGRELAMVDSAVNAMISEYAEKKIGYRSTLCGYVRVIFSMLLRNLSQKAHTDGDRMIDIPSDIATYIEENCFDKITLSDIAAMSFYNPAYFGRLLKKHYGKTFSAYIKEKRMDKAAELLCDRSRTIDEVISLAGYSDRKLFYKHFKESYGKTPKEYRDQKHTH